MTLTRCLPHPTSRRLGGPSWDSFVHAVEKAAFSPAGALVGRRLSLRADAPTRPSACERPGAKSYGCSRPPGPTIQIP
jgi:hypothetical protein